MPTAEIHSGHARKHCQVYGSKERDKGDCFYTGTPSYLASERKMLVSKSAARGSAARHSLDAYCCAGRNGSLQTPSCVKGLLCVGEVCVQLVLVPLHTGATLRVLRNDWYRTSAD